MRDQELFLERALLEQGYLDDAQLRTIRTIQAGQGLDFASALMQESIANSRTIALVRADICESCFVDLADFEPCFENVQMIPQAIAKRHCLFPLFSIDNVLTVIMDDPLNLDALDQIRQLVRCEVDAVLGDHEQILTMISRAYSLGGGPVKPDNEKPAIEIESDETEDPAPVIAALNQILSDAVEQSASDVHLNPDEHELRMRYRIDGVLQERQSPALAMHGDLVRRIKVITRLDLTQTRRPQDGKFRFQHPRGRVDVRVSVVPTVCGENVVMRLLANIAPIDSFHELGVPADITTPLEEIIAQPYGMLLVSGPTGSGKTTTLYTALNRINEPTQNIMTIEDPVEIRLPYLRQIQIHSDIGMTFASALRSILRQDPDVVLVGEIRDEETATIALQAALTGHLVLSTVHTNDACGTIARLRDFNLPPFVIGSAVLGAIAQRLVRRVCANCQHTTPPDELSRQRFGLDKTEVFAAGSGCQHCGQTGYHGRVGIYELLRWTPTVQQLIDEDATVKHIRERAVADGMRLMWRDGLEKARLKMTTLEEVSRAAMVSSVADSADESKQAALKMRCSA